MKEIYVQVAEVALVCAMPISVIIYHLVSIGRAKPFSKSTYIAFVLATFVSIFLQFLIHVFGFITDDVTVMLVVFILGVISFVAFLLSASLVHKLPPDQDFSPANLKSFFTAILLINLIFPAILARIFINGCDNEHKEGAKPLINAIFEYKADNGHFPQDLSFLFPSYLAEIPDPVCLSIYHPFVSQLTSAKLLRSFDYSLMMKMIRLKKIDYSLLDCSVEEDGVYYEEYYLLVTTFDLRNEQRYNFSRDYWQTVPFSYGCGSYSSIQHHELTQNPSFLFLLSSSP